MTTLAAELETWIKSWSDGLLNHRLLLLTKQGRLTPRALALYLESLRHLFQNSRANLELSAQRAQRLGLSEISAYLAAKAREESGHDTWAVDDLARLPRMAAEGIEPAAGILRLVELQRRLIEQHPMCFVAYAQWAEYFTVRVGDAWLDALAASGYARNRVSAIAKHVDADRLHAAVGFAEIDRLWTGEPDRAVILGGVEEAGRLFESFCDQIASEATRAA